MGIHEYTACIYISKYIYQQSQHLPMEVRCAHRSRQLERVRFDRGSALVVGCNLCPSVQRLQSCAKFALWCVHPLPLLRWRLLRGASKWPCSHPKPPQKTVSKQLEYRIKNHTQICPKQLKNMSQNHPNHLNICPKANLKFISNPPKPREKRCPHHPQIGRKTNPIR